MEEAIGLQDNFSVQPNVGYLVKRKMLLACKITFLHNKMLILFPKQPSLLLIGCFVKQSC